MGLIRDLGQRAIARIARRVARDELFEKPGERAYTPPVHEPVAPPAPVSASAPSAAASPRCEPVSLEGLLAAIKPNKRPMIVHHWATWCEPCEAEMPRVEALRLAVAGRADMLGLSWDLFEGGGEPEYVASLVSTWSGQLGSGLTTLLVDAPPEQFFEALGLEFQKIPQTQVISADGRTLRSINGPLDEAELNAVLALLQG